MNKLTILFLLIITASCSMNHEPQTSTINERLNPEMGALRGTRAIELAISAAAFSNARFSLTSVLVASTDYYGSASLSEIMGSVASPRGGHSSYTARAPTGVNSLVYDLVFSRLSEEFAAAGCNSKNEVEFKDGKFQIEATFLEALKNSCTEERNIAAGLYLWNAFAGYSDEETFHWLWEEIHNPELAITPEDRLKTLLAVTFLHPSFILNL